MPILSSLRTTSKPGMSLVTKKHVHDSIPSFSSAANTVMLLAMSPPLMKTLRPRSDQPPSTRFATVPGRRLLAPCPSSASDPAEGSVIA